MTVYKETGQTQCQDEGFTFNGHVYQESQREVSIAYLRNLMVFSMADGMGEVQGLPEPCLPSISCLESLH